MAIKSIAVSVTTTAAAALTTHRGTTNVPCTVVIVNTHASGTLYYGGPNVSSVNGVPIPFGQSASVSMLAGDVLWLVGSTTIDARLGYRV